MSYLRNSIAYNPNFWYTCVEWWYLQVFFSGFQILIFWVLRGVKEQKMVQNNKKFCPSHSVSQEPYIIWLSFMLHLCKMIISPGNFSFSQDFDFWVVSEVKGQRMIQNDKKVLSVALHIWGTIHHMTVIYVCKMIISSGVFSFFLKILIFWVHRGVKEQKTV